MKNAVRIEAISALTNIAGFSDSVAQKIVNKCEGFLVSQCVPCSWVGSVVVYIETTDGRSFERVFSKTGCFLYNRKAK